MKRTLMALRSVRGVKLALVATEEGILVAAEGAAGVAPETAAALASRFHTTAVRIFEEAGRPRPDRAELCGSEGKLLLQDLDGAFLAVFLAREVGSELEAVLAQARARLGSARHMASV